jgi:hypothetical protein
MSGCYQCGLPEGSDVRLCETCYRNRFYRALIVVEPACAEDCPCMEISPRMQRWVLSSGAVLCIGILGLALLVQGAQPEMSSAALQKEFVRSDSGYVSVNHQIHFGSLAPKGATKS